MLKVRCFKTTGDHRPFLSKFDVKLGSWGIIHTGEHSPLEVSTKPLPLPPGSSAGFTPRAPSASPLEVGFFAVLRGRFVFRLGFIGVVKGVWGFKNTGDDRPF